MSERGRHSQPIARFVYGFRRVNPRTDEESRAHRHRVKKDTLVAYNKEYNRLHAAFLKISALIQTENEWLNLRDLPRLHPDRLAFRQRKTRATVIINAVHARLALIAKRTYNLQADIYKEERRLRKRSSR